MTEIKTYEDVCQKLGINPDQLPGVDNLPEHQRKSVIAHAKLLNIAEALNDGWKPDWSNYGELKWYAWFDMNTKPSGGFSFGGCFYGYSGTFVGSRLCFKSKSIAEHAAKTFLEIYKDYFVIE